MPGVVKSITCVNGRVTAASGGLVDYADIQNVADARLLGRSAGSAGSVQEITVGTGLSLAAGTLSSVILSPLTTKGDLWGFDTDDARVPVGTNGQILTADSTAAAGVSWQAPAPTYTDEQAQDAVGTILVDSDTIDFDYADATPAITASVKDGSVTYAKVQDVSAASRLLGRGSAAGAGDVEEVTLGTGLTMSGTTLLLHSADAAEIAQDAVGGILTDSQSIAFVYNDGLPGITATVRLQKSITVDANGIALDGDAATPPADYYYGTNGTGTKGWHPLPAYDDEQAQDAVGTILTDSSTIDFTYTDGTPSITASVKASSINLASHVTGTLPDDNGGTGQSTYAQGDLLYASAADTLARLAVGAAGRVLTSSGTVPAWTTQAVPTPQGRLTLTSGTPVTTADVTAAGTIYYTPHVGNLVGLYDGTKWVVRTFSEMSLSLASLNVVGTVADVFLYDNAGTLGLEAVAWTNATTRATALTRQDGVWVKSGSADRLYLGTLCISLSSASQTHDSESYRFVWNAYNRVPRPLKAIDTTDSWTYTTATWRQARGSGANRVDYVCGLSEDPVRATVQVRMSNGTGTTASVGVGVDATNANSATLHGAGATSVAQTTTAVYLGYPGIGYHYLAWLEISGAAGTTTWYGDLALSYWSHGMTAEVMA